MGKGKLATILLIAILTVSSIVMVESASGTTKPSIPEFTVQFVSHPYNVPTTYEIDRYTGETITNPGYHVENRSLEIEVKNQIFTDRNGSNVNFCGYNVRFKGHYEQDWRIIFDTPDRYPTQSSAEYTIITPTIELPTKGQVDFQVQALIGTITYHNGRVYGYIEYHTFEGETSEWSNTQTISINESASTATPMPTPQSTLIPTESAPTQTASAQPVTQDKVLFSFEWKDSAIVLLGVVVAVLVLVVVLMRTKKR